MFRHTPCTLYDALLVFTSSHFTFKLIKVEKFLTKHSIRSLPSLANGLSLLISNQLHRVIHVECIFETHTKKSQNLMEIFFRSFLSVGHV